LTGTPAARRIIDARQGSHTHKPHFNGRCRGSLPLLLMKLPLKSYDTNFHIFFASHYVHHWFNPWNPKWYAGFSQTTYPPSAAAMGGAGISYPWFGHGIYGCAACRHLASCAGRLSVFPAVGKPARRVDRGSGECFSWIGKLPGLFRGAVGHNVRGANLFECSSVSLRVGQARQVAIFSQGECAFHGCCCRTPCHASLWIIFFAVPVLALVFLDRQDGERISTPAFVGRTAAIAVVVGAAIAVVLLPFWIALIHNPVTQDSHPAPKPGKLHPESAVGPQLLHRSVWSSDSGPALHLHAGIHGHSASPVAAWFLGGISGGTRWDDARRLIFCLGRAFDVLTMERFSYWATLLALPFVGLLASELVDRYRSGRLSA
jgi:hypothetical protein